MDVILGMGTKSPSVPFERAEFVRADQTYSIMNRLVKATRVDTILHTFMITNSSSVPRRAMRRARCSSMVEVGVISKLTIIPSQSDATIMRTAAAIAQ